MNNNFIKIFGHSTKSIDGEVFKKMVGEPNGVLNIVELGTFYARHTVLWNEIAESIGQTVKYTTIDEESYPACHNARNMAKENIAQYAPHAKIRVVKDFIAENTSHEDESIDILHVDIIFNENKLSNILQTWAKKVSMNGYLTWHIANKHIEESIAYKNATEFLENAGYTISKFEHIAYAKKIAPYQKDKSLNKQKTIVRHESGDIEELKSQDKK